MLIACEFSGIVRDAFKARGFDAWSCDWLPSERKGQHIQGDVHEILGGFNGISWDLMVAHPPCTFLSVAGNASFTKYRHLHPNREAQRRAALAFVQELLDAPIPRIALENPVGVISSQIRKPDQIVQPWYFGHPETKATCLWLKGLPLLKATQVVEPVLGSAKNWIGESKTRWKDRSRTFSGLAKAMASQWTTFPGGARDS